VLVRLEDSEYQAQLLQAQGNPRTSSRNCRVGNGLRPEEKARSVANLQSAKADLENARINLNAKGLFKESVQAGTGQCSGPL
jgi:multidrug resistance efflux pump